jgi:hypothetical protein
MVYVYVLSIHIFVEILDAYIKVPFQLISKIVTPTYSGGKTRTFLYVLAHYETILTVS